MYYRADICEGGTIMPVGSFLCFEIFLVNWSNFLREKSQKEVLKWQQWIIME